MPIRRRPVNWRKLCGKGQKSGSHTSLGISLGCFQQLFQLFECFGVIRANWGVVAAGIGSLQSATHGARNWNWSATVIHFAHEIPLWTGLNVATKAVSSKAIDHSANPLFRISVPSLETSSSKNSQS